MRRKVAVAVVAFLAAFSFAGVAFATHAITGEVVSANPSAKTLMITVPEQAMAFVAVEDPANRTQVPPLVKVQWPMMTFNVMEGDRKSTRLNSSHHSISYAVFCLKKKK